VGSIRRVYWAEAKLIIERAYPEFYQILAGLDGIEESYYYVASYGFGDYVGITTACRVPNNDGDIVSITDSTVEKAVQRDLLYGAYSAPLGMIIKNCLEWHHIDGTGRLLPDAVQGEGTIFNIRIIFNEAKTIGNNYLSATAGSLSAAMLSNIGCRHKHTILRRELNLDEVEPKSPYEHYTVFKDIVEKTNDDWSAEILFFPESFIKRIQGDERWLKLKYFFSESYRRIVMESWPEIFSEELLLSAKRINRLRPTPYFIDTAKYIFRIFTGAALGLAPAVDESCFPLKTIQTVYRDIYGLPYTPTVMVPQLLNKNNKRVYYPMIYPITKIDAFRTHVSRSAYKELEQIKDLLKAYQTEFMEKDNECYGSPLYEACRRTSLSYYHFRGQRGGKILSSKQVIEDDPRFGFTYARPGDFPYDAKLFRGCICVTQQ
jgi:hypothetical protein